MSQTKKKEQQNIFLFESDEWEKFERSEESWERFLAFLTISFSHFSTIFEGCARTVSENLKIICKLYEIKQ